MIRVEREAVGVVDKTVVDNGWTREKTEYGKATYTYRLGGEVLGRVYPTTFTPVWYRARVKEQKANFETLKEAQDWVEKMIRLKLGLQ